MFDEETGNTIDLILVLSEHNEKNNCKESSTIFFLTLHIKIIF